MVKGAVVDAADFLVSARVRNDLVRAQHFVEVCVSFVEVLCSSETVDKSRCAAGAVSVGEDVEHLETARIRKVRCIRVDGEGESGVRSVRGFDRRGKIPKGAIVGWPDKGNTVQKSFSG